jgi:3-deoxy-D-manno-octulosonate 8-phosphate phosphatase (KDO 8-P phosphatase)
MVKKIRLLALDIDGVLTDGTIVVGGNETEGKRVNFQDLDAINEARKAGFEVAFVTGETSPAVDLIAQRFNVQDVIKGAKDKVAALTDLASRFNISMGEICYVGDSNRDAPALSQVGLGIAPANATSAAKKAAHHVLQKAGGTGAVAETVELLFHIQNTKE